MEDDVKFNNDTQEAEGGESDHGSETRDDQSGADTDSEESPRGSSTPSCAAPPTIDGSERSELPNLEATLPLRQIDTPSEVDAGDDETSPRQVQTVEKTGDENNSNPQEDTK
ncbi:hypothetical protein FGRMN_6457 [Fusarium graminum]|nr:hypothetical protein FGRMN_6457 [Fusarium graminum]